MNRIEIEFKLHRGRSDALDVRADALVLLSELSDEQLLSKIPGAPWGDGTVGGVLAVHASHYRMHRHWTEEATSVDA